MLVHATTLDIAGLGVLILGASGVGKSDLALRLIADGALLVADDQTLVEARGDELWATAPATIAGLIEARGVGIVPTGIKKDIPVLEYSDAAGEPVQLALAAESEAEYGETGAAGELITRLEVEMKAAAKELEFERAAALRNRIRALRRSELELKPDV